ncbi:MAG: sugar phosphate isomerase/epimerase [Candidatus Omnitrophica bacterium]|nr:sugar phosphate isomerase/epimerase [Candidatus Omnitrophota bacterium]
MGLGLSTAWNAFRHVKADELISEIRNLGFDEVELSFNLDSSIVDGIERLVKAQIINIKSVHNFCPIPENIIRQEALPDYYSMSSINEEERLQSLRYTKRSIDTAARLGAETVVLHAGRVDIPDQTRFLIELHKKEGAESEEFQKVRYKIIKERRENSQPYFENTLKSLDELNRYAQTKGIFLGIETRFYYCEIPSFEEMAVIFERFLGGNIFYWHDTGHAQVMQHLGFNQHRDFLDCYGKYMIGIHLHDVLGFSDHKAPSKGELDFSLLKPYIDKQTIKIIEAYYPATPQEIRESSNFLYKLFDGKI